MSWLSDPAPFFFCGLLVVVTCTSVHTSNDSGRLCSLALAFTLPCLFYILRNLSFFPNLLSAPQPLGDLLTLSWRCSFINFPTINRIRIVSVSYPLHHQLQLQLAARVPELALQIHGVNLSFLSFEGELFELLPCMRWIGPFLSPSEPHTNPTWLAVLSSLG